MRKTPGVLIVGALVVVLSAGPGRGENWPQWRGPFFNGSTTEKDLPTKFSPTENVVWSADLPGVSGSTPIVWNDRVFVTAMEPASKKLWALCLNGTDGTVRWKRPMGKGFTNQMGNTGASPSPITDGKGVWFSFGTGQVTAMDMAGKVRWQRDLQKDHGAFEIMWRYGGTGLLYAGRLYIAVLHGDHNVGGRRDVSYLLCVDPATGKDLWKRPRVTDAPRESRQAYITPFPLVRKDGVQILLHGADHLTGHDPTDGRELWRSPNYNPRKNAWLRTVPSAVGDGDVAVGCAPKGGRLFAVRTVASDGEKAGSLLWTTRRNSPDVCTPLIYQGKLFVLDGRKKELVCMEPRTGKVIWQGKLGAKAVFQASPTGADGKVYCINLHGEAVVVSAGEKFEVLHRANMGGRGVRSMIVAAGGRLLIRTDTKLYCIGKKG